MDVYDTIIIVIAICVLGFVLYALIMIPGQKGQSRRELLNELRQANRLRQEQWQLEYCKGWCLPEKTIFYQSDKIETGYQSCLEDCIRK